MQPRSSFGNDFDLPFGDLGDLLEEVEALDELNELLDIAMQAAMVTEANYQASIHSALAMVIADRVTKPNTEKVGIHLQRNAEQLNVEVTETHQGRMRPVTKVSKFSTNLGNPVDALLLGRLIDQGDALEDLSKVYYEMVDAANKKMPAWSQAIVARRAEVEAMLDANDQRQSANLVVEADIARKQGAATFGTEWLEKLNEEVYRLNDVRANEIASESKADLELISKRREEQEERPANADVQADAARREKLVNIAKAIVPTIEKRFAEMRAREEARRSKEMRPSSAEALVSVVAKMAKDQGDVFEAKNQGRFERARDFGIFASVGTPAVTRAATRSLDNTATEILSDEEFKSPSFGR